MSGTGTLSHQGTLGQNISFQYSRVPKILTMTKVNIANVKVMAMLPVMLAPPGNMGTSPIRLLTNIKKNAVSRYGV